ncbi:MAG: peptide-methionine (S)-S-oxide reductase [Ferruginibacter sp.]
MEKKMGFGGGCHWCTEAVFASLTGIKKVEQGFIRSTAPFDNFSEAVIVTFEEEIISLQDLIDIHLHTHSSSSHHSMRLKYRSAIYYFTVSDEKKAKDILKILQQQFPEPLITTVIPFDKFKSSLPEHLNYYSTDPKKPFCKLYIHPKLALLKEKYSRLIAQ